MRPFELEPSLEFVQCPLDALTGARSGRSEPKQARPNRGLFGLTTNEPGVARPTRASRSETDGALEANVISFFFSFCRRFRGNVRAQRSEYSNRLRSPLPDIQLGFSKSCF